MVKGTVLALAFLAVLVQKLQCCW